MDGIGITLTSASVNEASVATFARSGASFVRFIAKGVAPHLYLTLTKAFVDCGRAIRTDFDVLIDLPGRRPLLGSSFEERRIFGGMTVLLVDETADRDSIRGNLVFPTVNLMIYRDSIRNGDRMLISDGSTELKVLELLPNGILAEARRQEALLTPNRSILLPDTDLHYRSVSQSDHAIAEAVAASPSLASCWVALSMVESADSLHQVRRVLPKARLIAKIETRQGVINRNEIAEAADLVMIARGDLSLSLGVNFLPAATDLLLRACEEKGRDVMLATGIFDGVTLQDRPTASDLTDLWYYWNRGVRSFLISSGEAHRTGRATLEAVNSAIGDFRFAKEDLGASREA
jgi:pyruvate kinase